MVHEATVSIPLGGDLKLFAGQIPDWQGYEYLPLLTKPFSAVEVKNLVREKLGL